MKFIIQILIIFALSSFLAKALPAETKKGESSLLSFAVLQISKECIEYIEKHKECPGVNTYDCGHKIDNTIIKCIGIYGGTFPDVGIFDKECKIFESEKCQNFFKTSLVDVSKCKNTGKVNLLGNEEILKMNYVTAKFFCGKDEKGNYCPLNHAGLKKKYDFNTLTNELLDETKKTEIYGKAIKDTCSSQKCVNDYLTFIDEVNNDHKQFLEESLKSKNITHEYSIRPADKKNENVDFFLDFDKKLSEGDSETFEELVKGYINFLKKGQQEMFSEQPIEKFKSECKAVKSEITTSDATHFIYNNAIFVTFILLLYTLI